MTKHFKSSPADYAMEYIRRGWNPVPIPYKTKKPIDQGWQKRVIREEDVPMHFNGQPQNIGVIMGSSSGGLTDMDLDCREAVDLASWILPPTPAIFGRASNRASHWLYRTSLHEASYYGAEIKFQDPTRPVGKLTLLELRIGGKGADGEIKGAQTVFPGSVHETDEAITWDEPGKPAEVEGADLVRLAKQLASCCLLARYWPGQGARHDAALALGGFLARAGFKPPYIKKMAEGIARTAGDPEWKDRRTAAEGSAQAFLAGKRVFGFPRIKELFGEEAVKQVAEWLDYQGSRDDETEASTADEARPTADPVDLWAKFDPPTLPRGVLPDILERFAFDRGQAMGADMAGIAVSVLAVCAAAIPDKIKLRVKRHDDWLESARIWVAIVGSPSSKKSPIMTAAVRPLRKIDAEMARQNAELRSAYDKLDKKQKAETDPPKQTRLLLQDTTIEAAQEVIKDSPNGVLCFQDEMSGWFGSMDKYSNARGAAKDRAFWLEAFNGNSYSVARPRVHRKPVGFPDRRHSARTLSQSRGRQRG